MLDFDGLARLLPFPNLRCASLANLNARGEALALFLTRLFGADEERLAEVARLSQEAEEVLVAGGKKCAFQTHCAVWGYFGVQ